MVFIISAPGDEGARAHLLRPGGQKGEQDGVGVHRVEVDVQWTLEMLTWRSGDRLGINSGAKVVRAGRTPEEVVSSFSFNIWCSWTSPDAGALGSGFNSSPATY